MGKAILSVLFLVVGLLIGGVVGLFALGAATGVGVATGLSAGICATMQAAQEEGLLNAGQIDQVMTRAADDLRDLRGKDDGEGEEITGTIAQCAGVMQRMREANEQE